VGNCGTRWEMMKKGNVMMKKAEIDEKSRQLTISSVFRAKYETLSKEVIND
jgi:hypothetical protein